MNRLLRIFLTTYFTFVVLSASMLLAQYSLPWEIEKKQKLPKVDVSWGLKIPMRDGVKLHAVHYQPTNKEKANAAIVVLTPYMADTDHDQAMSFAEHGYHVIVADVRGRGNSEGEFEPFVNDGKDGHDLVEWTAQQKWCNGKIGMWGGSYGGFVQWSTLKEFPKHLCTIAPTASPYPGVDFPAPGGIFHTYYLRWLLLTSGKSNNPALFSDESIWIAKLRKRYVLHRPFQELDEIIGLPSKHFQSWLKHRGPDDYWKSMVPPTEAYEKFDIPILTITGHYDSDQRGAMEYYHRHMKYGSAKGKRKHHVIMGPWDHAGTRKPVENIGGLDFNKTSLINMEQLYVSWFDYALKNKAKPHQLERGVIYFVSGLGRWKQAETFAEIPVQNKRFFLTSDGRANDVFHSGELQEKAPKKSSPDTFTYDPRDTRPAELEKQKTKDFLISQQTVLNLNGNGLVYHSSPLVEAMEISGYMKFTAWLKMNVPDTDLAVSVHEIKRDGTSVLLASDQLRARYRRSLAKPTPVKMGEIDRYHFASFPFVSRKLEEGSRIRLVVRCPNSIHVEKNYNSGGVVEQETLKDARVAQISLFHSGLHLSFLELPVAAIP